RGAASGRRDRSPPHRCRGDGNAKPLSAHACRGRGRRCRGHAPEAEDCRIGLVPASGIKRGERQKRHQRRQRRREAVEAETRCHGREDLESKCLRRCPRGRGGSVSRALRYGFFDGRAVLLERAGGAQPGPLSFLPKASTWFCSSLMRFFNSSSEPLGSASLPFSPGLSGEGGNGENIFIVCSNSAKFCLPICSSGPNGKSPPNASCRLFLICSWLRAKDDIACSR